MVWVLQRGHSSDECNLASTLCKYDLRKGDLFVLSWTRVRQVNWGKSLFRAANVWWRCICIWHMFVDLQFRLPVSMKVSSRIALLTCPINSHVTYQWGEVLHVDPFHSLVGLKNQLTSVAFCRNAYVFKVRNLELPFGVSINGGWGLCFQSYCLLLF